MFSIGNGPRRYGHLLKLLLNSRWNNTIDTGFQQQGIVPWRSPIYTVCLHQVWRSPISSVLLIKWTIHQSPVCTSSSAPFTNLHCAPSTSAPFTNLHCVPSITAPFTNLQCHTFYQGSTNLHCCASTVAPFYGVAPLLATILCHVIMLLDNSTLSTILLPMWIRLVYYLTEARIIGVIRLPNNI